uniref:Tyrosine-sulfated glycopeptide receptor 1 n=1 Tax=Aegilops tauschii TaxID=37682 RepID=R7W944_AEGTA
MRAFTIHLAVLQLVLLLSLVSPATSCAEQEKHALLQFLAGILGDGALTASWRHETDCCEWEGITCNGDGAVTEVSLASRGLEGRISPSLADITSLLHVNLSRNSFSGVLPPELMHSSGSIIVLDVSFNRLNGLLPELPYLFTTERPLQVLNISSNQFSSKFPSATWKVMKNLIVLNASNNSFTGHIPSSLCIGSPSLALLDLYHNQLNGDIPNTLGNCSKLKVLKAGNNHLSWILPVEIFHATPQKKTSLEYLSFPNNGLQGELDGAHMVKRSNLAILDLGGNQISGNIPQSIGHLKRLEEIHLGSNNMSGELPSSLGNCTNLKTIDLKINKFSGDLGKQFGCTAAVGQPFPWCNTTRDRSSESTPLPELGFQQLPWRDPTICNLTNLQGLDLSNNHLTGAIPVALENLHFLSRFNISNNDLEGPIPATGQLSMFQASSFDGKPKLSVSVLTNHCSSVKAATVSIISAKEYNMKVIFSVAFGLFFGIGVLYDQLVLFRYFG